MAFGSCIGNHPSLAAPPDYSSQVTLTPSAASLAVGSPVTITWHLDCRWGEVHSPHRQSQP